jgi:hypothetical protein
MHRGLKAGTLVLALSAILATSAASANAALVYDNIPTPLPGNLPSQAYEATQTSEFGGQVQFAGTARRNPTVTVTMSSWGCQSGHWYSNNCATARGAGFTHPITLKVYAVGPGNTVGYLLATRTQTFRIPYRPSADPTCTDGRWRASPTQCYNGKAANITFNLSSLTLPNKAIVSVAYNTTHYGYAPIGESPACFTSSAGCGYDSLNVGVTAPPTTGSDPLPADAYLNSSTGGQYCDGGAGGTGTFRLDAGCWTGSQPAVRVKAKGSRDSRDDDNDNDNDGNNQNGNGNGND